MKNGHYSTASRGRTLRVLAVAMLLLAQLAPIRAGFAAAYPSVAAADCAIIDAPAGSQFAYHVYAEGVQIYNWNGTSWSFVAPAAVLYADAQGKGAVGLHFGGPTWQSVSGSKLVARVAQRCTPDANAIPWLLLEVVSSDGPGIFNGLSYVQRVNTVGGNAPAQPGSFNGEVARIPYTAEYVFYRSK